MTRPNKNVALWYDPRSLGVGCRRGVKNVLREMMALSASIGTTNPPDHQVVMSRMGVLCGGVRDVRWLGTEAEVAAVERAHAELVQALHATIRAAEPAGGAR